MSDWKRGDLCTFGSEDGLFRFVRLVGDIYCQLQRIGGKRETVVRDVLTDHLRPPIQEDLERVLEAEDRRVQLAVEHRKRVAAVAKEVLKVLEGKALDF